MRKLGRQTKCEAAQCLFLCPVPVLSTSQFFNWWHKDFEKVRAGQGGEEG
jgi:hypothetical protein